MKKIQLLFVLAMILVLGACAGDKETPSNSGSTNDGEAVNQNGAIDHGVKDKEVGFSLTGESIEEAEGVPAKEKVEILEAFETYIETFNEKDIDQYMETLSKDTESFDLEEERAYMLGIFEEFDLNREATDITIVKYSDSEVQLFSELQTTMKQLASGLETKQKGRQVTVMTKDEGDWKVASIHYVGDQE